MPRDLDGLADIVVLTVKNAMAPAYQRIAVLESDNAALRSQLSAVAELRDRVVVVETKAAIPPLTTVLADPVDLSPMHARIAVLEKASADVNASLVTVTDLRDRVVAVETKAAIPSPLAGDPPPPADLTPVLERVASLEAHVSRLGATEQNLGELRDRVTVVETRRADLAPVPTGLTESDVELAIRNRVDPVAADVAAVRERLIAVEVRQPIPGPAGQDGAPGTPGTNGKDGVDGLGFDDLMVVQEDDRSFAIKAMKGDRGRDIGRARFPVWIHRGVYIESKSYEPGDVVTWAGSQWHANEVTTTKPGDGLKAWTLIVKRGRDGKDGRDALEPVPVVRAGAR